MNRQRFSYGNVIVVASALVLVALIGLLTVVASNLITATVREQFRSQETQLVGTLSRQVEFFFDTLGADLLNLAARQEVQSITSSQREGALVALVRLGERRQDSIRAIVRLNDNGAPRYAWPPEVNERIMNGEQFDWSLSSSAVRELIGTDSLVFRPVPARGGLVFLLFAPVQATSGRTELLAFELDLEDWFGANLGLIDLGDSGQLWVLDGNGRLLYEASDESVSWADNDLSLPLLVGATEPSLFEYEAPDGLRQAAFAPARSYNVTFFPIISRLVAESQQDVQQQINLLFGMTLAAVLLVGALSWVVVQRILGETRHREQAEQR
ncbi:MAG: cache domain-containing protein, partial [Anaerolineae bacterium]|nr:cache domain-containing protein [Anaerolineae bacterium]